MFRKRCQLCLLNLEEFERVVLIRIWFCNKITLYSCHTLLFEWALVLGSLWVLKKSPFIQFVELLNMIHGCQLPLIFFYSYITHQVIASGFICICNVCLLVFLTDMGITHPPFWSLNSVVKTWIPLNMPQGVLWLTVCWRMFAFTWWNTLEMLGGWCLWQGCASLLCSRWFVIISSF